MAGFSLSPSMYSNPSVGSFIPNPIKLLQDHKFNNKMGNIQIKDRPRKNYSIFGQRQRPSSRSPFREVIAQNSPYYRELSPIRYSPISRDRRSNFKQSLKADSSTRRSPKPQEKQSYFPSLEKPPLREVEEQKVNNTEGACVSTQNKEKCEQIIRKVRNFNDFLVQLKRKLREDCSSSLKPKERNEVSMSVRLENERVELEKYKKLVERQLSKTHSIQNISIQNASNGEKILTIQYEDISILQRRQPEQDQGEPTEFKLQDISQAKQKKEIGLQLPLPSNQDTDIRQLSQRLLEISKNNDSVSSKEPKGLDYEKKLKQAKALWAMLQKKTHQLGQMLAREEESQQGGEELKDYLLLKERLVKVGELYASIESANRQSIEIEKKIKGLLA